MPPDQEVLALEVDDDTITGADGGELEVSNGADSGEVFDAETGQPVEGEQPAGEEATAEGEGSDTDELIITIGDEPAAEAEEGTFHDEDAGKVNGLSPEQLAAFIRLRQQKAEAKRKLRQLEERQRAAPVQAQQAIVVGAEPELVEFADAEEIAKFKTEHKAWLERKHQAEQQEQERKQAEERERVQWQGRLDSVTKAAATLKVPDMEDAGLAFEDTFSIVQQGIIMSGPKDPKTSALLRYALGKNPKLAKELAAISNPVQFAFAVAEQVGKMKVTKKSAPQPERRISAGGSSAANVVAAGNIEKLHAEAQRTGDFTKYLAAKRAQKERKAA